MRSNVRHERTTTAHSVLKKREIGVRRCVPLDGLVRPQLAKRKELLTVFEPQNHPSLVVHEVRVKVNVASIAEPWDLKDEAISPRFDFGRVRGEVTFELGIGYATI